MFTTIILVLLYFCINWVIITKVSFLLVILLPISFTPTFVTFVSLLPRDLNSISCEWIIFCSYFRCNVTFHCVCGDYSAPHWRFQKTGEIEIVGAGGKYGFLASADWMWTVASSQRHFLNGNARNFLRLVLAILSVTSRRSPFWIPTVVVYLCVWCDLWSASFGY